MHDFEAANPDELELKRGDIVLVVPTELVEDQVWTVLMNYLFENFSSFKGSGNLSSSASYASACMQF